MIDLCFLIPAVIAQIFYPTEEFEIPIGISIKEAEAEMGTHSVIVIENSANLLCFLIIILFQLFFRV